MISRQEARGKGGNCTKSLKPGTEKCHWGGCNSRPKAERQQLGEEGGKKIRGNG